MSNIDIRPPGETAWRNSVKAHVEWILDGGRPLDVPDFYQWPKVGGLSMPHAVAAEYAEMTPAQREWWRRRALNVPLEQLGEYPSDLGWHFNDTDLFAVLIRAAHAGVGHAPYGNFSDEDEREAALEILEELKAERK